jgi:hypothetical protein
LPQVLAVTQIKVLFNQIADNAIFTLKFEVHRSVSLTRAAVAPMTSLDTQTATGVVENVINLFSVAD